MERSSYRWVSDLQQNSPTRLQAIADLSQHLERGIYHYLSHERSDLVGHSGAELRQIAQNFATTSLLRILDNLALFKGASKFITWASKHAARVSTTGLESLETLRVASSRSDWSPGPGSAGITDNSGMQEDEQGLRIGRWEDDGGRILKDGQSAY